MNAPLQTAQPMTQSIAPKTIQSVEQLEDLLSQPGDDVVDLMKRLQGDIILLGVGGKIGPSLARMARRATDIAGIKRRVIGVSRFGDEEERRKLEASGIETLRCDLLDQQAVTKLPDAANVIYLAGLKFGSSGKAAETWAMNTFLPSIVCQKFSNSRIVAYSTGAVYGMSPVKARGSRETDPVNPIDEYAMSCLGRERMFEYFSKSLSIPVALIRLFYSCEVRYGVLVDLAQKIHRGEPIDVSMGYFNVIWQGDNNAMTLLALEHAASPPFVLNITGPEFLLIREAARVMGERMGREPIFCGTEQDTTCAGNASSAHRIFGQPRLTAERLMDWAVDWVQRNGEYLGKPTHFEVRDGRY